MPKFVLPTRGYYERGSFTPAGEPFDLAEGITPPRGAVPFEEYTPAHVAPQAPMAMSEMTGKPKRAADRH